jgi:pyruvate formate lyase activating enzyme
MAKITGWQKSSFIDFPGTVSTVLFLSGCNLRCPYCHNPGIVLGQYEPIPFDEIKNYIRRREGMIEGAVITGGEPSLYGGLLELCDELKAMGLKVKIDTNGLEPEKVIMCDYDYLALDIKTSFKKYQLLNTPYNDNNKRLCQSVDIVKTMGECAEVRITAVPGIIGGDDIDSLCMELRGVNKIFIQQFSARQQTLDPSYRSIAPYTADELEIWRKKFLDTGIDCRVRGIDI